MAQFFDYMAQMSRNESKITIIENGKSVTMSLKDYKAKYQPKDSKKSKKSKIDDSTSITRIESEISAIELHLNKYVKSIRTYSRKGYRMWGTIHTNLCETIGIKSPLNQICGNYSRALAHIKEIKAMSRKNDSDCLQFINYLEGDLKAINEGILALASGVSTSGILTTYKGHEMISGSKDGRRLGIKRLVMDASRNMMDIDSMMSKLRTIVSDGVDATEYVILSNGKAKRK